MEQHEKIYRRRFYAIVIVGGCGLSVMAWLFVKGTLTPRGFGAAALICMVAMFVAFMFVILSFQRAAREFRESQIANGVSADSLDREQYIKTIRSMKWLIAFFGLVFVYDFFAAHRSLPLNRMVDAGVCAFLICICIYSLFRAQKKLKSLSEENEKPSTE